MAVDLRPALYLGLGAATKGVVAGLISGFAPGVKIAPEMGTAVVGYIMADRTADGTFWNYLGKGVLIGSISQMTRETVEGFFQPIVGKARGIEVAAEGGGEVKTPEDYIKSKYGV